MVVRLDGASGLDDGAGGPATLVAQVAPKLWVNFDGNTASQGSFGLSSLTDNGTGNTTVNATSAMSDTRYAALVSGGSGRNLSATVYYGGPSTVAPTASAFRLETVYGASAIADNPFDTSVSFVGDLA